MDQNGMKSAISRIRNGVEQAINASPSPEDKMFAPLVLAGIDLLGEMLIDIKRIADAAERYPGEK